MGRWITDHPLHLEALIAETVDHACGALIVFVGAVRSTNDNRPVRAMTYEAHVGLAEKTLQALEQDVLSRFEIGQCRIQHRMGTLQLGEASVIIVVRAAHREAAYQASRYAIDELKQRVPIWKEEHYADGGSRYLDGVPLRTEDHP